MSDIQIKQFEKADQDALLLFLRQAFSDDLRKSEPAYWQWYFLDNPYTDLNNVPLWIVKSGQKVVGQMATIPIELKIGAERKRAFWGVDFVLHQDYRGLGLGKRLLSVAQRTCSIMMGIGFNENSERVLRSLGWTHLGSVNRYHKLLFPGNAYREIRILGKAVQRLANLSYSPFRPNPTCLSSTGVGAWREVTTFDAAFDRLWRAACVQWTCAATRSARYLNWQYSRQPGKKFDILGLYDKDELLGYVVLFFRKTEAGGGAAKAAITDLCYSPHNATQIIDELLRAALRLAVERRVGSLVTDVLDPRVEKRLRHLGFWNIKNAPAFWISAREHQDLLYDVSNWFLTRGDADVSIFEEFNL